MELKDVVIIGAGQAGLALSRHLSAASIDHIVLEAGQIGQSWRNRRWAGLRLFTPNWLNQLPRLGDTGDGADGFMPAGKMSEMLVEFARNWDCPIRSGIRVHDIVPDGTRYQVHTSDGIFRARSVVFATGAYADNRPAKAGADLTSGLMQIGSADYVSADALPPGAVLVVGAGASGVQIAEELALSGRRVALAAGRHTRAPRQYRDRDVFWWMQASGILSDPIDRQHDVERARAEPSPQLAGRSDGGAIDFPHLATLGVDLAGRFIGADGARIWFADDLANSMQQADRRMQRMKVRFDAVGELVDGCDDDFPDPAEPIEGLTELDTETENFGSVIWAAGFPRFSAAGAFQGLEPDPSLDADGISVRYPGLFALGLPFQRTRFSTFIGGADAEGAVTARLIQRHLDLSGSGSMLVDADAWKTLSEEDTEAVGHHFAALAADDRRHRFGTAVTTAWLAGYVEKFFTRPGIALGFVAEDRLAALGELRPSASGDRTTCELGLSVVPSMQSRGLGRQLFRRLQRLGRRRQYRTAELYVDAENTPMKRICQQCDAAWAQQDSMLYIRVPLTAPY